MNDFGTIRESRSSDLDALMKLYPAAFPDEDLRPIVRSLLSDEIDVLSLVATKNDTVVGHVAFTPCTAGESEAPVAMLAPLCVSPSLHKQGIGSALVRQGFQQLREKKIPHVTVLGDPAYYHRFGFRPDKTIAPPYPMEAEWVDAWQSMSLIDTAVPPTGQINVPDLWKRAELWQL
ncbi:MAG: N-acetyltransferase [Roseibium sp.]